MEKDFTNSIRPFLKELTPLEAIPTGAQTRVTSFKPKAVIFDIYGTLLISASGDVDKAEYNGSMIKKGLDAASIDVLVNTTEAFDRTYSIFNTTIAQHYENGRLEGRPYPEVDIIAVWTDTLNAAEGEGLIKMTEKSDILLFIFVFELQTNKVWPMPGMEAMVKKLGESGVDMGIVSNAQFYTPVILNHLLYDEQKPGAEVYPFKNNLSVYSFQKLRGKPDVALYEYLLPGLEARGIKPEEALFVGNDMLKDMYAASQIGMKTVFFAGDMRAYRLHENDERTMNLKPDFVITELNQIFDILGIDK